MTGFQRSSGVKEIVRCFRLVIVGSGDEPHMTRINGDDAMRATLCLIGGILLSAALPAHAARLDPETRIAKALTGRVAGKPVDCIQQQRIQSSEIFERTAILYKAGNVWYLNRPDSGKNFLNRDDILVTNTHSPNLCSIDIVRLLDSGSHFPSGSLGLGKFVPYTKPKG